MYSTPEATSPAVAMVRLAAGSAVLGSPVFISITTLRNGSATGEQNSFRNAWQCMFMVLSLAASPAPRFDFTSINTTLTFPSGSQPLDTQSFSVTITNDDLVEGAENIPLQAFILGGTSVGTFTVDGDTANIDIVDDDGKAHTVYVLSVKNCNSLLYSSLFFV